MQDKKFGKIEITINDVLKEKHISKNKIIKGCKMQRTQLNKYCNQKIQRLDTDILARICYSLNCDIKDILKYNPPKEEENESNT